MAQAGAMGGMGGMGGPGGMPPGGVPPGANVIQLTQEEMAAVTRLTDLGFSQQVRWHGGGVTKARLFLAALAKSKVLGFRD